MLRMRVILHGSAEAVNELLAQYGGLTARRTGV
jgi:hypothetical protein